MEKIFKVGHANSSGEKIVIGSTAHTIMSKSIAQAIRKVFEAFGAKTTLRKIYTAQELTDSSDTFLALDALRLEPPQSGNAIPKVNMALLDFLMPVCITWQIVATVAACHFKELLMFRFSRIVQAMGQAYLLKSRSAADPRIRPISFGGGTKKSICIAVISLGVIACASHTGIVQMGKDTYMVAKQQATGFPGLGNMKAEIIGEASQYCSNLGKELQIVSTQETQPPYILGNYPRSEFQFMCLVVGDRELQRPKLLKAPDTAIEVRKS